MDDFGYNRASRRCFLRGAAGVALTIPFLPSLLGRAAASTTIPPRFIAVNTRYGQYTDNWYPTGISAKQSTATAGFTTESIGFGSEQYRHKALSDHIVDSTPINPVLRHPGIAALKGKLNMVLGMDMQSTGSHSPTCFLTLSKEHDLPGTFIKRPDYPWSFDRVLELSPSFYPREPIARAVRAAPLRTAGGVSFGPDGAGGTASYPLVNDLQALHNQLFADIDPDAPMVPTGPSPRALAEIDAISAVLPAYNRVMASDRISATDRQRLESFAELLADAQRRRMEVPPPPPSTCTLPGLPSGTDMAAIYSGFIDTIVAAVQCNVTRNVVFQMPHYLGTDGDWHTNPHNGFHNPTHMDRSIGIPALLPINQWYGDRMGELLTKLDERMDPDGCTLLDNSLVFWGSDVGDSASHRNNGVPILLAGSASGRLRTDQILDFRRIGNPQHSSVRDWRGAPMNFLFNAFGEALGLPQEEYEKGAPGEGFGPWDASHADDYATYWSNKATVLPGLLA